MLSRATFLAVAVAALLAACGGGGGSSADDSDHALLWLDTSPATEFQRAATEFRCVYEVAPYRAHLYTDTTSELDARITASNALYTDVLSVRKLACRPDVQPVRPDVQPVRPACSTTPREPRCR